MKDIYVSTENKAEKPAPNIKIKSFLQVSMNVIIYFRKKNKLKNNVKILIIILPWTKAFGISFLKVVVFLTTETSANISLVKEISIPISMTCFKKSL